MKKLTSEASARPSRCPPARTSPTATGSPAAAAAPTSSAVSAPASASRSARRPERAGACGRLGVAGERGAAEAGLEAALVAAGAGGARVVDADVPDVAGRAVGAPVDLAAQDDARSRCRCRS